MTTITHVMRDVLIEHMDGLLVRFACPANASGEQRRQSYKVQTALRKLRACGYITSAREDGEPPMKGAAAHWTRITVQGRHALSVLLADYADTLMRYTVMEQAAPENRTTPMVKRLVTHMPGITPERGFGATPANPQ